MATTSKKLKLPPALGSYASIFKPKSFEEGKPKYQLVLIWPKKDKAQLAELQKAIVEIAQARFGTNAEGKVIDVVPLLKAGKLKNPLRDGDIERSDDKAFANSYFLTASSERAPGIVDRAVQPVFDEGEAYSGCTFRASVALFAFDKKGNKGVAVGLNNLQVVAKGPRLDGKKSAEDDFKDFAVSEEDAAPAEGEKKPAAADGNDDLLG